jgi:hypothetical protein
MKGKINLLNHRSGIYNFTSSDYDSYGQAKPPKKEMIAIIEGPIAKET